MDTRISVIAGTRDATGRYGITRCGRNSDHGGGGMINPIQWDDTYTLGEVEEIFLKLHRYFKIHPILRTTKFLEEFDEPNLTYTGLSPFMANFLIARVSHIWSGEIERVAVASSKILARIGALQSACTNGSRALPYVPIEYNLYRGRGEGYIRPRSPWCTSAALQAGTHRARIHYN